MYFPTFTHLSTFAFYLLTTLNIMQAENAVDQMDWMEKITGVITSLLSVQTLVHHLITNINF